MDTNRVIVLTDPMPADVAAEAARRAGASDGQVIVSYRSERVVDAVRALLATGARPIPALAIEGDPGDPRLAASARTLLADAGLADLEVPVPAVEDDDARRVLWDQLRALAAEERHHLVEVDPGPVEGWLAAGAAAAGVLAGRRAAADRRWGAAPA